MSDFWHFIPATCRNCSLSFQRLKLRKIVPSNLVFLQSFSDIKRKIVEYCREVSGSTFKTACKVSKSVPWGNFISFKIDDIFQKSCGLQQKKSWRIVCCENCFFFFVGHSVKIWRLLWKNFRQSCKKSIPSVHKEHLVIYFPIKSFLKTNREKWVENCSLMPKVVWQNCQSCILNLHGITLKEVIFLIKCFFDSFLKIDQKLSVLCRNVFQQDF